MSDFKNIPFLRILIPFIIGIITAINFSLNFVPIAVIICLLIASITVFVIQRKQARFNFLLLGLLDVILFVLGISLTHQSQLCNKNSYFNKSIIADTVFWVGIVDDIPVQKAKTLKLKLNVVSVKHDSLYKNGYGNVIVYLQNSLQNRLIKPGSALLLKSPFQEVNKPLNPHAFDFKSYLNHKSIYHTAYVDSNSFQILAASSGKSIWQLGLAIKFSIIKRLKEVGLSNHAQTICTALITGFDDDIDKEVLESFSHSGTMHVLSVSGLHVGLIYLVLNFFIGLVDRNKKYKLFQLMFISVCLWFFALITGFSAPVLRSVIMFNLLGFGNLFFRNKPKNQINILFVSAFGLLFYDPLLILDIGFLLSYSALFGILYFHPKFVSFYSPENKILKYVWESSAVSLSATITTLPITLLVFHQFPIWFVLANLVIVPATFALLLLAFVALIKIPIITLVINKFTGFLIAFIELFNSDKYAFIDYIDFSFTDALMMILILVFGSQVIMKRRFTYVLLLLCSLISWQVYSILSSFDSKTRSELVIYHLPKASTVSVKNKTNTVISALDSLNYSINVKSNLVSYNYTKKEITDFNYVSIKNAGFFVLNKKNHYPENENMVITHVLIENNTIPSKSFLNKNKIKVLIADGSNNRYTMRKLEDLCAEMSILFYATKSKGAYVISL